VATFIAPTALLIASFSKGFRRSAFSLQWLAPIPALLASLLALWGGPFGLEAPALRLSLQLDLPGALLLAVSALLWSVVSAGVFLSKDEQPDPRFSSSWLLTMIGSLGVFIANDLLSFYLVYALVSIPAWGVIVRDGSPESKQAGGVYMAFAIVGEALLLFAFAMLAAGEPKGSVRISDVMGALPSSPWRDAALALTIAAFGAKMGLAPLNGWMPLTYNAAPIPAAAVLSGAGVKAGVIGLIRFLPLGVPLEGWGEALAVSGFVSAFYGVAVGVTQRNPKVILAYSSISQMGVIAAALGMALAAGDANAQSLMAFYAANHVLVKGSLFLTIGAFAVSGQNRSTLWLVLAFVVALSLAGLPFTGGALAKGALKPLMGNGLAASLANLSSAASALLMLRFVMSLTQSATVAPATPAPAGLLRFWPLMAAGAALLPYLSFPFVGDLVAAFTFSKVWDSLWPILIGGALAVLLTRADNRLPRIPAGDTIGAYETLFNRCLAPSAAVADAMDALFRQWPAATLALLAIALVLAAMTAYAGASPG
jgi:formate hydrogenlyase subunit 3/multisubunit Na+/H+ antiporter MnhD subunit